MFFIIVLWGQLFLCIDDFRSVYCIFKLFLQVLIVNIVEYVFIVYIFIVGFVCQNYSGLYRRLRGMYFSFVDRGEMMLMVYNWLVEQVYFMLLKFQVLRRYFFLYGSRQLVVFMRFNNGGQVFL